MTFHKKPNWAMERHLPYGITVFPATRHRCTPCLNPSQTNW